MIGVGFARFNNKSIIRCYINKKQGSFEKWSCPVWI